MCIAGKYDRGGTVPGREEEKCWWCERNATGRSKTHTQTPLSCGGGLYLLVVTGIRLMVLVLSLTLQSVCLVI